MLRWSVVDAGEEEWHEDNADMTRTICLPRLF